MTTVSGSSQVTAGVTIPNLPPAGAITGTEDLPLAQGPSANAVRATLNQLLENITVTSITIDGQTITTVTGTGSMVLSNAPSLTGVVLFKDSLAATIISVNSVSGLINTAGQIWTASGIAGQNGDQPLAILGAVKYMIRVVTVSGDVTVATTDYIVVVNKGTGAATAVNLPATPATGLTYCIKDGKGDAASHNITITPAAGNIDGSSTFVMNKNYAAVWVTYNGTQWNITSCSDNLFT